VNFVLEAGTTFQTASNNNRLWTGANVLTSNQVQPTQLSKTTGATFDLTGIKLEFLPNGWPLAATPFARNAAGIDLLNAQRYYAKTFPQGTAPAQSGGVAGALCTVPSVITAKSIGVFWSFPAAMRVSPTITTFNPSAANANWRDVVALSDLVVAVDPGTAKSANGVWIGEITTAPVVGNQTCIQAVADARL
jgi:hypothetical protein